MTKVYIVSHSGYSPGCTIHGVYSTLEKAKEISKTQINAEVVEIELDAPPEDICL